jgi:hypothetical protein
MACGGIITPVLAFSAAGMLNNTGIGLDKITSAVSAVAGTAVLSPITAAIASAPAALAGLGSLSPLAFAANSIPANLIAGVTAAVPGVSTLTESLQTWAGNTFGGAVAPFAQTLGQLQGFATNAFQTLGAVEIASNLDFSDLGINAKNYVDALSGGLGNLVSQNLPDVQGALGILATDIQKTGALLNFNNLSTLGSPGALVTNLVNSGLGNVGGIADKLVSAGVNLTDINNPAYSGVVSRVLNTVSGADLGTIAKQLEASLPDTVRTAADLLSVEKLLPSVPLGFNSFADLGNQLSGFVQKSGLKSAENFGNLLKQMEIPQLDQLKGVQQVMPDSVKQIYTSVLGSGSGPYNNPTLTDMLGTVTGLNIAPVQGTLTRALDAIAGLSQGQDLINIANSMIDAPELELPDLRAEYEDKLAEIASLPSTELQSLFSDARAAWESQAQGVISEKSLYDLAGVNFEFRSLTDRNSVLSLASNLHEAGIDQFSLGSSEIFEALATSDVYGEAVQAALVEGRNLQRQLEAGFQSTARITVRI